MKIACFLAFCLLTQWLPAQQVNYSLTKYQEDFVPFTNGIPLFDGIAWSSYDSVRIPLGFDFTLGDTDFDAVYFECTGRLIFGANHLRFIDLLTLNDVRDAQFFNASIPSDISYRVTSSASDNLLEIQVLNAFINNGTDTLSFQITISESGTVKYKVGTNSFSSKNRILLHYSGVYSLVGFNPLEFNKSISFYGTHDAIQDTSYSGLVNPFTLWQMTGSPSVGTVFELKPRELVSSNNISQQETNARKIFTSQGLIKSTEREKVKVFDGAGRLLYEGYIDSKGVSLNHSGLIIIITSKNQYKCILE